jgi:UDP-N-acetylmuramoyl-L-alanyl-D-glutamate--2,6-diaminopimelate ligase
MLLKKGNPMTISRLFQFIDPSVYEGRESLPVKGLVYDSRKAEAGDVFVALKGSRSNGHDFVSEVLSRGAYAVVQEGSYKNEDRVFRVPDTRKALAYLSKAYFNCPDRDLKIVGVTGTNGKTTTTYMIRSIFEAMGIKTGVLGTIQILVGDEAFKTENTTPESYEIYRILDLMRSRGCKVAAMEISSHALVMSRAEGLELDAAIFTNLTQDHLDFHQTLDRYLEAKIMLFDLLKKSGKKNKKAFINADIEETQILKDALANRNLAYETFGVENHADWKAYSAAMNIHHNIFTLSRGFTDYDIDTPMLGLFNLYNALGAVSASVFLGAGKEAVEQGLSGVRVPGRFERVQTSLGFGVVVDYAHTPDALENLLATALNLNPQRLITVFGAGGDRDKGKRPLMGKAAREYSDYTLITSDNPRSEDPKAILKDIEAAFEGCENYEAVEDRDEAIKIAVQMASEGDLVVIAGKGHEDYQIFKDQTVHFSDRERAEKYLREREALFAKAKKRES